MTNVKTQRPLSPQQQRVMEILKKKPMRQTEFWGIGIRLPTVRSLVKRGLVIREASDIKVGGLTTPQWRLVEQR